jgi:small-conductance mechanosensitive channel
MSAMWRLFWPAVAFLLTALAALGLRAALLSGLRRFAARPAVRAFADVSRLPSVLWSLVLALWVAIEVASQLEHLPRRLGQQLNAVLEVAIILSVTITVAGMLSTLIARASDARAHGGPVTGLAQTAARGLVFGVGGLVVLSALGIEITPILTALGVGGLAVALALQDTLSNLFAGMHLLADRPIRVGDYVKIADSVEGYVVDVGWRSTRVRMLQNVVVVVPNKKVAESVVTNYDLPEPRLALLVPVAVSYESDPDHVERVLVDEATGAAREVAGLLADPPPFVRFIPGFGAYSLDFTLICQVATFVDQYAVQHELRKRILRRFRAEGIEIPFPTRTTIQMSAEASRLAHQGQQPQRADHRQG